RSPARPRFALPCAKGCSETRAGGTRARRRAPRARLVRLPFTDATTPITEWSRSLAAPGSPSAAGALHLGEELVALLRGRAQGPERGLLAVDQRDGDAHGEHAPALARLDRHLVAVPQPLGGAHVQPRLAQIVRLEPVERRGDHGRLAAEQA